MLQKTNWIILIILSVCTFFFCIRRDIELEKQYPGDLRNRIVGARLQKDGHPPYFYKWSPGSLRYYDPQNFDSLKVSNITATPFLHQLLYPLAETSQRSVSRIWLWIEYELLLLTVILALSFTKNRNQQLAVVVTTAIFLLSSGWKVHIAAGQYYLLMPALAFLFFYFINNKNLLFHSFMAGIVAASLVLLRPNIIFFLLPFLFFWNKYHIRYRIVFAIAVIALASFSFISRDSRSFWIDYRQALGQHLRSHQALQPAVQRNVPDPGFITWEGWDKKQIERDAALHPFRFESEHGNLFVITNHLFKIRLPVWALAAVSFLFMSIMALLFFKRNRRNKEFSLFTIAMLGFCLYMISDICSPFYRFQYNSTQYIFPLLLLAAHYNKRYSKLYIMIAAGMLLNIIEIPGIPFEHTAGEYMVLAAITILAFVYRAPDHLPYK
jgi:hypothetical protein